MDSPVEEYDSPVSAGGSDDSGNANYDDFPEIGVFTIPTEPFFEEPEEENDGFTQISQRLSQFIFQEPLPVDMVLKLARHFRWKVIYILHDEKGPAHHKTFSVKMTITFPTTPALQFFAEGTTIKKSKHAASMKAITDLFERDIINDEILRSVYQENSKSELDKVLKTHYPSLLPINYSVIALPDWSGCSYSATINRAGFAYVTGYGRTKREAKNQAALLFLNEIRPYQDHGQTFHYEKSCRKWPNNASKHLEKSSSCSVSILNELSLKSKKRSLL